MSKDTVESRFFEHNIFRNSRFLPPMEEIYKKFTFDFSHPQESTTAWAFIWMATRQEFILRLKR